MDRWKRVWASPWRTALFAGLGAVAGVTWYELVGCRAGGTCANTSSVWRSAANIALVAPLVGWPGRSPRRVPDR
jgi:hypothetical protein